MSLKVLIAPLRYVQGPNALFELGEQLHGIGITDPLVMGGPKACSSLPCREE